MKYALIIPDGAADAPLEELDGRSPLAAARTPHMDWIATNGRQGTVLTVPDGFDPHADCGLASLLGYDPREHFNSPVPFEALVADIALTPTDLVFRCDLVTIVDARMADPTAGHIGAVEAARIIESLNERVAPEGVTFHSGNSFRNLMVVANGADLNVQCASPYGLTDKAISPRVLRGRHAERIRSIAEHAERMLADLDINDVRRDLGENPVTGIWLWAPGRAENPPSLAEQYGIDNSAVVTTTGVMRGFAAAIGMQIVDVSITPDAVDVDHRTLGDSAVAALDDYDLVVVHLDSARLASLRGDLAGKIRALEQIDECIVGPVLNRVRAFDEWKIMVAPAHAALVADQILSADPCPFCTAGHAVHTVLAKPFCEAGAAESDLHCDPGYELMEYFLKR